MPNTIIILIAIFLLLISLITAWLFFDHGIDKLKNPKEWKDNGSSGEQILYNTLLRELHISKNQILRNVYVPTNNGKTSEIDLLVVSKKGIFVFECKNYSGNIYGDAKRKKWVQYIGHQKNYFYNPILQNENHAKHLKNFLKQNKIEIPIIPLISTISRGKWQIKNLASDDYLLGINCHLQDIYTHLPDSQETIKNFNIILEKLKPFSRPNQEIQKQHIEQIKH